MQTYDVHERAVPETIDLDVVRRPDEVGGGDGAIGDQPEGGSAMCAGRRTNAMCLNDAELGREEKRRERVG